MEGATVVLAVTCPRAEALTSPIPREAKGGDGDLPWSIEVLLGPTAPTATAGPGILPPWGGGIPTPEKPLMTPKLPALVVVSEAVPRPKRLGADTKGDATLQAGGQSSKCTESSRFFRQHPFNNHFQ